MDKRLAYYFDWGPCASRDVEKLVLYFMGKCHWEHFGRLAYNKDIEEMLIERD
jgi:hypothetical protein